MILDIRYLYLLSNIDEFYIFMNRYIINLIISIIPFNLSDHL